MTNDALQRAKVLAANPAAAAMVIAATRHKAETNATNEAKSRGEREAEAKVTIDVGSGTLKAEGVPVDDFEESMQEAHDRPYNELTAIMSRMAEGLNAAKIKDQLSTHKGRLGAARELGANALTSRIDAWRVKTGRITPERAVEQVQMQRQQAQLWPERWRPQEQQHPYQLYKQHRLLLK